MAGRALRCAPPNVKTSLWRMRRAAECAPCHSSFRRAGALDSLEVARFGAGADVGRFEELAAFKFAIGQRVEPDVVIDAAAFDDEVALAQTAEDAMPKSDFAAQTNFGA